MLTTKELNKIEIELSDVGLSEQIRRKIRNAKICIIDDKIDDLKSLHDSLKQEGFTNLQKFKKSPPINDILAGNYDVVILDLNDVATEISKDDGLGILKLLKVREPKLPILVVTGQLLSPAAQNTLNLAELVRKKPVYAADLANDVDMLLRIFHDKYWASLILLKELNYIDIELKKEIDIFKRLNLHFSRKKLEKKLIAREEDIVIKLEKVLKLIKACSSATSGIQKIASNFLN